MTMLESKPVNIVTKFGINVDSKKDAIIEIIRKLKAEDYITDPDGFANDVFRREGVLPTYIGHGIGLPHSQSEFVKNSAVVVGRLVNPIVWNDDNKVSLIFLIAVPEHAKGNLHLKILANLSRLLMHEDFRRKLETLSEEEVKALMYSNMEVSKGG